MVKTIRCPKLRSQMGSGERAEGGEISETGSFMEKGGDERGDTWAHTWVSARFSWRSGQSRDLEPTPDAIGVSLLAPTRWVNLLPDPPGAQRGLVEQPSLTSV